ncbi:TIGR01906 family membrane protein [Clostridium sp. 'White wine YQ']|uniref:TIGR01906 family membrane protein n=1 Tax=Clostridium sp. 'White wine YQ' TaxID=3027474 RepID=UPI0023660C3D|nr:TIGR01906 family membrane protein [Clostridium sp. 'White wine YQ']MDD7795774.1 TIGR01906 family membrane protein [Clostridium sp. 'White wine YQ']
MKISKSSSIYTILKQWLFYICYFIFSITLAFKVIINLTPFYKLLMNIYNIPSQVSMNAQNIYSDFTELMKYLRSYKLLDFPLKYFKYSPEGKFHFDEVRVLFLKMDILFWISLIVLIIFMYFYRKNIKGLFSRYIKFLITLLILCGFIAMPIIINFSWSFEKFHKIFFNNNDWLFDPVTDPIINALPEEVFSSYLIAIVAIFFILLLIPQLIKHFSSKNKSLS